MVLLASASWAFAFFSSVDLASKSAFAVKRLPISVATVLSMSSVYASPRMGFQPVKRHVFLLLSYDGWMFGQPLSFLSGQSRYCGARFVVRRAGGKNI